jgi:hypothetical protein
MDKLTVIVNWLFNSFQTMFGTFITVGGPIFGFISSAWLIRRLVKLWRKIIK